MTSKSTFTRRAFIKACAHALVILAGVPLKSRITAAQPALLSLPDGTYGSGTYGRGPYSGPSNHTFLPLLKKEATMPRLPTIGQDIDNWGALLNEFLRVSHRADGAL